MAQAKNPPRAQVTVALAAGGLCLGRPLGAARRFQYCKLLAAEDLKPTRRICNTNTRQIEEKFISV